MYIFAICAGTYISFSKAEFSFSAWDVVKLVPLHCFLFEVYIQSNQHWQKLSYFKSADDSVVSVKKSEALMRERRLVLSDNERSRRRSRESLSALAAAAGAKPTPAETKTLHLDQYSHH